MDKQNSQTQPSINMIIAMTLSGSIGVFVVESNQAVTDVIFFRCLFGLIALALYYTATRSLRISIISIRMFCWLVLSGITMSANWIFFFKAYSHASISSVTIVYHVYPFVLLIASAIFFHESIPKKTFVWAAIAFLGVACIVGVTEKEKGMDFTGFMLTMTAILFYSITLLIAKKLKDIPPGYLSMVQLAVGVIILSLQINTDQVLLYSHAAWGYLISLGLIHTALLYILLYGAVQKLNTTNYALLSFLYPLTALLFDVAIYDVRPSLIQLLGMCLILIAIAGEKVGKRVFGVFQFNRGQ